jgi:hypothetical protein
MNASRQYYVKTLPLGTDWINPEEGYLTLELSLIDPHDELQHDPAIFLADAHPGADVTHGAFPSGRITAPGN